jgi:hypothetical protein
MLLTLTSPTFLPLTAMRAFYDDSDQPFTVLAPLFQGHPLPYLTVNSLTRLPC